MCCFTLPNFGMICYAAMFNEYNINLYISYNFRSNLEINCKVREKLDKMIPKLDKRMSS